MSGGGGSSTGTSTTTNNFSPAQLQMQGAGLPMVQQFTDAYNQGNVKSPGQQPFTPNQVAGQTAIANSASPGGSIDTAANDTAGANQYLLKDAIDVNNNPAIKGMIDQSNQDLDQNFKTNVIPTLRTNATNAGALGGSRDTLAQNEATNSYLLQRGNNTNTILNNAYNTGLNAMVQGVNASPNTMRALTFPGTALDAVGAEQQQQLTSQDASLFQQQLLPLTLAGQMFQYASGLPSLGTTTTTTPAQPTSLIGRLFG